MLRTVTTLLLLLVASALIWVRAQPAPPDSAFVGSKTCATCHEDVYAAWKESQHNKMMRRVSAEVVVADLNPAHPDLMFDPDEAVWAIGGKWEQQFMGHDGDTETLLPGAWLVGSETWLRKGWDGWEVPVPVTRCHGCHTVGLDVETGAFVEPNIGCESCHGPGRWHAWTSGLGRIHVSTDAQICGQCHTRGTSEGGAFHFPVGYKPGMDLDAFFEAEVATPDQTSTTWWGNRTERKRHQQFAAWRETGHARSFSELLVGYDDRYGTADEACLSCHTGDPILGDSKHGVTCAVCHNVHGELSRPRLNCADCHRGGAFYHRPAENDAHVPCPEAAQVTCVDCHMPKTVLNGGSFTMHSHSLNVVSPEEAERWDMPGSCANGDCHESATPATLQAAFEAYPPRQ